MAPDRTRAGAGLDAGGGAGLDAGGGTGGGAIRDARAGNPGSPAGPAAFGGDTEGAGTEIEVSGRSRSAGIARTTAQTPITPAAIATPLNQKSAPAAAGRTAIRSSREAERARTSAGSPRDRLALRKSCRTSDGARLSALQRKGSVMSVPRATARATKLVPRNGGARPRSLPGLREGVSTRCRWEDRGARRSRSTVLRRSRT
jgi:hypothetical protein